MTSRGRSSAALLAACARTSGVRAPAMTSTLRWWARPVPRHWWTRVPFRAFAIGHVTAPDGTSYMVRVVLIKLPRETPVSDTVTNVVADVVRPDMAVLSAGGLFSYLRGHSVWGVRV